MADLNTCTSLGFSIKKKYKNLAVLLVASISKMNCLEFNWINCLTPKFVLAGTKNSRLKAFG
jgi:hypothetical protein